jgi:hypothetical protein
MTKKHIDIREIEDDEGDPVKRVVIDRMQVMIERGEVEVIGVDPITGQIQYRFTPKH